MTYLKINSHVPQNKFSRTFLKKTPETPFFLPGMKKKNAAFFKNNLYSLILRGGDVPLFYAAPAFLYDYSPDGAA